MTKNAKKALKILVAYLALCILVAMLLHLKGADFWILVVGLALIGILAAAAYIWYDMKLVKAAKAALDPLAASSVSDELSQLLRGAEAKLQASKLGKDARFSNFPVIFLVGPPGSTKTTAFMNAGLEPELLAGQVYQDTNIVPTRFGNLWFAQQSVFVEPGTAVLADDSKWSRLIRRMQPGRLVSAVRKGDQAPRAAVLCFDCETFFKAGSTDAAAAAARNLHGKLLQISSLLGISLPVYVLFTKADRVSFFHDYFHTLTNDEASQVLGATLPLVGAGKGVYDEEQAARLNAAFDELYFSLCDKRTEFLGRENDTDRLPGTYEFPRELRKARAGIVQFLLDVCRPSQLTAAPFLRGFYFCGVRPIFVREAASTPLRSAPRAIQVESGATGIFRAGQVAAPQPVPASMAEVRKVPQWVFLKYLFGQVVLADHAALGASVTSVKTNSLRRILLGTAAAICLLLCVPFILSYSNNHKLETQAHDAAEAIATSQAAVGPIASLDDLTKLDALRQSVQTIAGYNRDGAPLSYRWGLYVGHQLYPRARQIYFKRFAQLLFDSTQQKLLANLKGLPPAPSPTDSYEYPYNSLKSYLITTSHHDKSTVLYLAPLLLARWSEGKDVDPARMQLARKQFDFYADELKYENPYSSENDTAAVEKARRYLTQFTGPQPAYRFMLAEINKTLPAVNFNQKFPGSAQTVFNNRDVAGAFTKDGWKAMQDALKHIDRYLSGEQWVLGDVAANTQNRASLPQDIQKLYVTDFIDQWRDYLKKSVVVGYSSIGDAANKLSKTASSQSPLLAMFCLASQATGADPEIAKNFKPLLSVVPGTCGDQYVGPSNQDYMKALIALQVSLAQIGNSTPDPSDPNVAQAASNATSAKVVTGQMAQNFGVDPLSGTVQHLLEAPITSVEPLVKGLGAAALNKGGRALCGEFRALMNKYPFNPQSTTEATLADVNGIFKPGEGMFWKFYDANLQKFLSKQGSMYVATPVGGTNLTPGFVNFFNRAAAFANAIYAGGPDPHFNYSLKPEPSEGIQSVGLSIDGQTISYSGGTASSQKFVWPGPQPGVKATAKFGGSTDITWATYNGLWSVFRFFGRAEKPAGGGSTSSLEWVIRVGDQPATLPNGKPLTVKFDLDMLGSPPVFQRGYFSNLSCVADVAK